MVGPVVIGVKLVFDMVDILLRCICTNNLFVDFQETVIRRIQDSVVLVLHFGLCDLRLVETFPNLLIIVMCGKSTAFAICLIIFSLGF